MPREHARKAQLAYTLSTPSVSFLKRDSESKPARPSDRIRLAYHKMEEPPSHYVASWKVPEELSDADAQVYGQKYRDFRLPILKLNPEAFSGDYVYESSLSKEEWASMIKSPNFHYFIALSVPVGQEPDAKCNEWVGSACFFGPMSLDAYNMIGDAIKPLPGVNETYWDISSCHTKPSARMGYVFGLVMHAAYDYINEYTRTRFQHQLGYKPACFRLAGRTLPHMSELLAMYKRKGYTTRGLTSRRQTLQMRGERRLEDASAENTNIDMKTLTVIEHYVRTRPGTGPHAWFEASKRRQQMMGDEKAVSWLYTTELP